MVLGRRHTGIIALIFIQILPLGIDGVKIFNREENMGNNFINVIIKKEFREVRVAFKGVLAMETLAFQNSSYELHFRQITNGHDLIQIILQNGIMKDCEYSRDPREVLEFVTKFSESEDVFKPRTTEEGNAFYLYQTSDTTSGSNALNHFKRRKDLRELKEFVKINKAMKLCNKLVKETFETTDKYNSFQYITIPKYSNRKSLENSERNQNSLPEVTEGGLRGIDENTATEHSRRKRSPINKYLIFPGTKWCGRGQTALHYDDIGEDKEADLCCRDHDCCPDLIPSFSSKYNTFNYRFHAILHCDCDNKFRTCLKMSYSPMATLIGRIYFNIMGSKCFTLERENVCSERSWWGYCQKYEDQMVAKIQSQETFNCF